MAGTIIADRIQLDTFTDTFEIVSNTDVVVLSANSSGLFSNVNTTTVNATDISATDISATSVNVSTITASANIDFKVGASQNTAVKIDSSENLQFNSGYGSVAIAYGCRAWVNFDGTTNVGGNCTIRASGNVSTVADNGTGNYTITFTNAMPDANYGWNGNWGYTSASGANQASVYEYSTASRSTTSFSINTTAFNSAALVDRNFVMLSVFR